MVKSSVPDSRQIHNPFRSSPGLIPLILLILFPLGLYAYYATHERQMVSFIMSLFPVESDKSVGFYRDFLHLIFTEIFWIAGFFLLAWLFVVNVPLRDEDNGMTTAAYTRGSYVIAVIAFIASLFVSFRTLETFANSSDEYAYLYQAKTLAKGKLWETGYQSREFYYFNHIADKDGIRIGRFPPGWPLFLSSAFVLGVSPALVNPIFGFLTLLIFFRFAARIYDVRVAFWSTAVMALTSFYIFNAASYFSHVSCAFFAIGFVYCYYLYLDERRIVYAILSGFCLGLIIVTRYYTAVLMFLPLSASAFYRLQWKSIRFFFFAGLGALPPFMFLLWYNYVVTGNPLTPVTVWAYEDEALGFVRGHTVIKGIEHVVRWTAMLIYWSSPAVLLLYLAALWRKVRSSEWWTRPEDYFYIVLMIGYFFYYQIGGNQYGPRFFFEAFPFVVVLIVNFAFQHESRWPLALLAAGLCFAIVKFPFISRREHQVIEERRDLERLVEKQHLSNAVVFVSSHTGIIRPMPIGDLTRNDLADSHHVMFVQDLGSRNSEIMQHYPGRTFYIYDRDREKISGYLKRLP